MRACRPRPICAAYLGLRPASQLDPTQATTARPVRASKPRPPERRGKKTTNRPRVRTIAGFGPPEIVPDLRMQRPPRAARWQPVSGGVSLPRSGETNAPQYGDIPNVLRPHRNTLDQIARPWAARTRPPKCAQENDKSPASQTRPGTGSESLHCWYEPQIPLVCDDRRCLSAG